MTHRAATAAPTAATNRPAGCGPVPSDQNACPTPPMVPTSRPTRTIALPVSHRRGVGPYRGQVRQAGAAVDPWLGGIGRTPGRDATSRGRIGAVVKRRARIGRGGPAEVNGSGVFAAAFRTGPV